MSRSGKVEVRENWRNVLTRFVDCGMTVAEFCELEGFSESNFYRWKRKLSAEHQPRDRMPPSRDDQLIGGDSACGSAGGDDRRIPTFVPVRVPATNSEQTAQLCLPGGAVVELTASLSRERLVELIAATVAATNHESGISNPASDVTNRSHTEPSSC